MRTTKRFQRCISECCRNRCCKDNDDIEIDDIYKI